MNTQFDLEQRIMQRWNIVDDLDVLFAHILDSEPAPTHDQIANTILGMIQLYDMKFYTLFSTFEKYLAEQHRG